MLIEINERKFVNTDVIQTATRNGNYTDILTKDGTLMQLWDEKEVVWSRLKKATQQEQEK
jgi:hypothetical protein